MKKIVFTIFFAAACFTVVQLRAQEGNQKKEQFQWNKLTMDSLGISEAVQQKINDIKKSNDKEIKLVKEDGSLTEDQQKEKIKELRKKRTEAIEGLLTPEQKIKAAEMKKAIAGKNKELKQ